MKSITSYSLVIFLFFYGCASTPKTTMPKQKDVPDWYLSPPKYEDKFIGVGDAQRPQMSLSKTVATTRAKAEIVRAVEEKMSTLVKDYMQASGVGSDASAIEFNESVTKAVSSKTLQGATIEKTEIINGRVFVMVIYDSQKAISAAKEATRSAAKKEEALYNEFKANQGFENLDAELENLKP